MLLTLPLSLTLLFSHIYYHNSEVAKALGYANVPQNINLGSQFTDKRANTFVEALDNLSKKAGVPVIADGTPANSAVSKMFEGSINEVLDHFAKTYDMTWKRSKSGSIIFNKAFYQKEEIPQYHPKELAHVSEIILKVLPTINEPIEGLMTHSLKQSIVESLTPDQLRLLRSDTRDPKGDINPNDGPKIATKDLTPLQMHLIKEAVDQRYWGKMIETWKYINFVSKSVEKSKIVDGNDAKLPTIIPLHILPSLSGPATLVDLTKR